MSSDLALPLPVTELPKPLRRFANPDAPAGARTMAAKGLVPVKGEDLVTLLVQLCHDAEKSVREAAKSSLEGLPENVLVAACGAGLHVAILEGLRELFPKNDGVREALAMNHGTANYTIVRLAKSGSERLCEIIATNEQRLLGDPTIVEALYQNRHTRMSTADRLVELCARNGVELKGIAAFKDHVEAIQGQLIPEATIEPLPGDAIFQEALAEDEDDPDAIEQVEGDEEGEVKENVNEKFKPLSFRIKEMTKSEKIRLAVVGDAAARSLLVRDPNRTIAMAAVTSPRVTEKEASNFACSREIDEQILRYIGNRKEWTRSYEVKHSLIFNPKTPVGVALKFIAHLRVNDLKMLSKSRNVATPIKNVARQRLAKKQKSG